MSITIQVRLVSNIRCELLPDVDRLAVVSNAWADTECEVSPTWVGLYSVVEVVGHSGSVRQPQTDPVTIDQRTVQPRDDALVGQYRESNSL